MRYVAQSYLSDAGLEQEITDDQARRFYAENIEDFSISASADTSLSRFLKAQRKSKKRRRRTRRQSCTRPPGTILTRWILRCWPTRIPMISSQLGSAE